MPTCVICGLEILNKRSDAKYCDVCKVAVTREIKRKSYIKLNPNAFKQRATNFCEICGSDKLVSKTPQGNFYCPVHYNKWYRTGDPNYERKSRNTYLFKDDHVEMMSKNGEIILVDKDDFDKIKKHTWCVSATGYVVCNYQKKILRLNRFLLSPPSDLVVDHINGDPLDNRKSNLRVCTSHSNSMNTSKNKGRVMPLGVKITEQGTYKAYISPHGRSLTLGEFTNLEKAIACRKAAEIRYFGEFSSRISRGDNGKGVI